MTKNLYSYFWNTPLDLLDPSGALPIWPETIDLLRRCTCKHRNPDWPLCPSSENDVIGSGAVSSPRYGAFFWAYPAVKGLDWMPADAGCTKSDDAPNCAKGVPGTRYDCEVVFRRKSNRKVRVMVTGISVDCCGCCHIFQKGTECHPVNPNLLFPVKNLGK